VHRELGVAVRTVPILDGVMGVLVVGVYRLVFVFPADRAIWRFIAFEIIKRLSKLQFTLEL
jgi:hypothetical protein